MNLSTDYILKRRLKETEALNEQLRQHIREKEIIDRELNNEFEVQLQQKDEIIKKLIYSDNTAKIKEIADTNDKLKEQLRTKEKAEKEMGRQLAIQISDKEDTIRNLKSAYEESEIHKESLARLGKGISSEIELSNQEAEFLKRKLKEKQSELSNLASHHSKRIRELEALNEQLNEQMKEKEALDKEISSEYVEQLKQKDEIIRKLLSKHDETKDEHLKLKIKELMSANEKLREHILLRDSIERAMSKEFQLQLSEKDETIKSLLSAHQESEAQKESLARIGKGISSEIELSNQEAELLNRKLKEKQNELTSLTKYYREKEKAYDDIQMQLNERLKQKNTEVTRLKAFIAEREEISQRMEEQLLKEIAEKDSELRLLKKGKHTEKQAEMERQIEHFRQIMKLKEATSKKYYLETLKLKEMQTSIQKELNNEKNHSEGLKTQYEKIITEIKKDNEDSVKSIISDYSNRQIADRTEIEKLKAELNESQSQLRIQKLKIDAAIKEFNMRSQNMMQMRESVKEPQKTEQTEESEIKSLQELNDYAIKANTIRQALNKREIELNKREAEINLKREQASANQIEVKTMLINVEQQLKDLERREDSLSKREMLLVKQQEAFNKELEALERTGFQSKSNESALEEQIKPEYKIQETKQAEVQPEAKVEEKIPIQKPKRIEQQKVQKQTMAKKEEKQPDEKLINLKEQTLGYSEVDEIISIIDVALQNKDTIEQVTKSLSSSGYSEESIQKALKKINLA